ncbi:MAG: preprotein translocase subunit SecA, partial [Omnitrophica WOR_2 bacterium SM23_29]
DILLGGNAEALVSDYFGQKGMDSKDADPKEKEQLLSKIRKQVEEEHGKVVELGGLHVIGTERHEARRIDNQLRGRAGRQGDPGSSRFYLSLADDLLRIFGSDRIKLIMDKLGMEEGQEIEHPWVTRAIETAQKRVESHNFEIRKHLLEYDNVMNKQREVIYGERRAMLEGKDLKGHIFEMIEDILDSAMDLYLNEKIHRDEWDINGFSEWLRTKYATPLSKKDSEFLKMSREEIRSGLSEMINKSYEERERTFGVEVMRHIEKTILLDMIDSKWKDHLYAMDILKEGIGLRAYGQVDPLIEYKNEAYAMFQEMIGKIKEEAIEFIFNVHAVREERPRGVFESVQREFIHPELQPLAARRPQPTGIIPPGSAAGPTKQAPVQRQTPKVGRNDPCPCGSGKKYKKCCGA